MVIGAAIIQNNKILLVKKREIWILPGGKPEGGESDIECLLREVEQEELPGSKLQNLRFFNEIEGIAPHKGDRRRVKVYLAQISGSFSPSSEIMDAHWVKIPCRYPLSDITSKIISSLVSKGYLK